MNYGVAVLCRPEVAAGVGLAGVPTVEAEGRDGVTVGLAQLLGTPDVGVILIEDDLYRRLPPERRRRLGKQPLPLIVPFPGPTWGKRPAGPEQYIVELLRQAIGYRVKLR